MLLMYYIIIYHVVILIFAKHKILSQPALNDNLSTLNNVKITNKFEKRKTLVCQNLSTLNQQPFHVEKS